MVSCIALYLQKALSLNESLPRSEKLKSRKQIDQLFKGGSALKSFPLLLIWAEIESADDVGYKVGVSVSKKRFKRAVDRNRMKRLIREAYRRHKKFLPLPQNTTYGFMFVYLSNKPCTLVELDAVIMNIIERFQKEKG